jgi:L-ascorbate metabolism protein UlaG (beta-lactamase superfamily)
MPIAMNAFAHVGVWNLSLTLASLSGKNLSKAGLVAKWVRSRILTPMHYDPDVEDMKVFAKQIRRVAPRCKLVALKPGETYVHGA